MLLRAYFPEKLFAIQTCRSASVPMRQPNRPFTCFARGGWLDQGELVTNATSLLLGAVPLQIGLPIHLPRHPNLELAKQNRVLQFIDQAKLRARLMIV